MHKLYEYVCDELKDLEKKAERGSLSMQEVEYADTLAHLKKNLMKADEMMEDEYGEYSMAYYPMTSYADDRMRSYAVRRDAMGRYSRRGYSRANENVIDQLHKLKSETHDEHIKREIDEAIKGIERM